MKTIINKTIDVTNGYKTKTAALVWLLISLFGGKVPFILENQEIITKTIEVLIATGWLHDIWRNRKKITEWIKNLFTKSK